AQRQTRGRLSRLSAWRVAASAAALTRWEREAGVLLSSESWEMRGARRVARGSEPHPGITCPFRERAARLTGLHSGPRPIAPHDERSRWPPDRPLAGRDTVRTRPGWGNRSGPEPHWSARQTWSADSIRATFRRSVRSGRATRGRKPRNRQAWR